MPQQRYWTELSHLKAQVLYVEGLCADVGKWDQRTKVFTALTSSVSIGSWLIWKEYSFIWAGVIAMSQVVSAVSPALAFNEKRKNYSSLAHDLETLFNQAEAKWYEIAMGRVTVEKINQERTLLRQARTKVTKKYFPSQMIPRKVKILEQAEIDALAYFSSFYPSEDQNEQQEHPN